MTPTTGDSHATEWERNRRRLGEMVQHQINDLGIGIKGAAQRAGVGHTTVLRIVRDTTRINHTVKPKMERVLGWERGSFDRVLEGGEPRRPVEREPPRETPSEPEQIHVPEPATAEFGWSSTPDGGREYSYTEVIHGREVTIRIPSTGAETTEQMEKSLRAAMRAVRDAMGG